MCGNEDARLPMSFVLIILGVALGLGFLAGGSLRPFERVRMHWWGAALAGLLLQVAPLPGGARVPTTLAIACPYGLLLGFVAVNRRVPAAFLMFTGLAMNLAVVIANGGMPVSADAVAAAGGRSLVIVDGRHHLAGSGDVIRTLGDTIPVPKPFGVVVSPGDVLLYAGIGWFVVAVMRGRFRENRRPPARWFQMYRGKHATDRSRPRWRVRSLPGFEAPAATARSGIGR